MYHLGAEAFESARSKLDLIMKNIPDGGCVVGGHSLGGNIPQQITANYTRKIGYLITMNAPGVSWYNHELFMKNLEGLKHKVKIVVYRTECDPVHYAGGYEIIMR